MSVSHILLPLQTPALRTLGNIVTGSDQQTQYVLDQNVLPQILPLLTHVKPNMQKVHFAVCIVYIHIHVRHKCVCACIILHLLSTGGSMDSVQHHRRAAPSDSGQFLLFATFTTHDTYVCTSNERYQFCIGNH